MASRQRISLLLIEDNAQDAELLQEYLSDCQRAEFHIEWKERLLLGLEAANKGGIDVILLDMNLPDSAGFDTLRAALQNAPTIPVVVLSGLDDEVAGIEAVRIGAQDYLVKGRIDGDSLFRVLRYAIERKRLEEQANERLRESLHSEARLASALGSMSEGFVQLDNQGQVVYMNDACVRLLAYETDELLNCNVHATLHPYSPDCKVRAVQDCAMCVAIKTGEHYVNSDDHFLTKNRKFIPVEYSVSPFLFGGEIVGSVLCFRNITERKVAEVRVREFYSTVSHELRTPLTSIRGALSLIKGGVAGVIAPEISELISIAQDSCVRLIGITNDMLDLRKIEANGLELRTSEIDAVDLVKLSLDGMLGMAAQHQVRLVIGVTKSVANGTIDARISMLDEQYRMQSKTSLRCNL